MCANTDLSITWHGGGDADVRWVPKVKQSHQQELWCPVGISVTCDLWGWRTTFMAVIQLVQYSLLRGVML